MYTKHSFGHSAPPADQFIFQTKLFLPLPIGIAVIWTVISAGILWYHFAKSRFIKNFEDWPKLIRKLIYHTFLYLFVSLTVMSIILQSLMISAVYCSKDIDPDLAIRNCTKVWESSETKQNVIGTLLIIQMLVPVVLLSTVMCLLFWMALNICKNEL